MDHVVGEDHHAEGKTDDDAQQQSVETSHDGNSRDSARRRLKAPGAAKSAIIPRGRPTNMPDGPSPWTPGGRSTNNKSAFPSPNLSLLATPTEGRCTSTGGLPTI